MQIQSHVISICKRKNIFMQVMINKSNQFLVMQASFFYCFQRLQKLQFDCSSTDRLNEIMQIGRTKMNPQVTPTWRHLPSTLQKFSLNTITFLFNKFNFFTFEQNHQSRVTLINKPPKAKKPPSNITFLSLLASGLLVQNS